MSDYSILTSAISDVGYWRWWAESLPEFFQLEFGGVQIHAPAEDKTRPPSSLLALRFYRPSKVSFIRRTGSSDLPSDWPQQLKEDKIDAFTISYDQFAVENDVLFNEVVSQIAEEQVHFNDAAGGNDLKFAFWAGAVGMRIEAAELRPVLMSGETELSVIASMHDAWWSYWRRYWELRDTAEAMPKDYACEVTIPTK